MLKNYLIIAYRNLIRQKGYSLINIAGLTIGIASCIMILLFVSSELSYDRYHEKSDRIYRAGVEALFGDSHFFSAVTSGAMKDALDYEFSEVEEACRLQYVTRPVVRIRDRSFVEDNFFYADSNFFDVFSVPFIKGDPVTALSRPNTVVISEETAKRYFGDENPLGRVIRVNENYDLEITGITENMPHNSHFRYDFLGSVETIRPDQEEYWRYWTSNNLYTYFLLQENTDEARFNERLQELVYKYVAPEVETRMGIEIESFETEGGVYRFFKERLNDIHLYSNSDNQVSAGGNITVIYFFSLIAIFILVIACINFMNLATARFSGRAKEIGVRKTLGSSRGHLIRQFLIESVLVSLISMVLAITLVELTLPWFNELTSKTFEINYLADWYILPGLIVFSLLIGILAGSYPAFFLSSFKPVNVLKGELSTGDKSSRFRRILVVVQFAITIVLIISTFIVSSQLNYWLSQDQGYKKEGLFLLKRAHILGDRQNAFREELLKTEGIVNASFCSSVPGYSFSGTSINRYGAPSEELVQTLLIRADEHYHETMGMELSEGRFFSSEYGADDDAIIINETLSGVLRLESPISENIVFPHINLISPVLGVLKDTNFESLHRDIRPMIIRKLDSPGWLMAIRIDSQNIPSVIENIGNRWTEFTGDAPFVWSFLENDILELYNQEMRTRSIFTVFSILAVFIACLGLLGMASFTTEKRTKEIGIRKAMGASAGSVMLLLSKEINLLILISTLLAWPAAWVLMKNWLDNFAYRIEPGILIFIASSLITYIIALSTVSFQAYRAARLNPVDTLRNE